MTNSTNQSSLSEDAGAIRERLDREMRDQLGQQKWPSNSKMVLAARILAREGHALYLAGQITSRDEEPGTYWTNSFGSGLANVTKSSVVRFDNNMKAVEGDLMPNPAVRFHVWVYENRKDVNAIVHTHPPHTSALAMIGEELIVSHMDAGMFYNDCAYLPEWPGVPLGNEEGQLITEALGDKRSLLLAHHGLLTTGKTLEEAVYLAIMFENAARLQLLAMSAGSVKPIRPDLAQEAHDFLLQDQFVIETFNYWASQLLTDRPNLLDPDDRTLANNNDIAYRKTNTTGAESVACLI